MAAQTTPAITEAPTARPGRRPLPICEALHCTNKLHSAEEKTAAFCMRHIQTPPTHFKPLRDRSMEMMHPTKPGYVRISEAALDSWWASLTSTSKAAVFQSMLEDLEHGRYSQ